MSERNDVIATMMAAEAIIRDHRDSIYGAECDPNGYIADDDTWEELDGIDRLIFRFRRAIVLVRALYEEHAETRADGAIPYRSQQPKD